MQSQSPLLWLRIIKKLWKKQVRRKWDISLLKSKARIPPGIFDVF